jgi:hypothetical protein
LVCSPDTPQLAWDVVAHLVRDYAHWVDIFTDISTSGNMLLHAYSEILRIRGALCRACPPDYSMYVDKRIAHLWRRTESRLHEYAVNSSGQLVLRNLGRQVERGWEPASLNFMRLLANGHVDDDIQSQLGILKAIDVIGLHLAQRDIFFREEDRSPAPQMVSSAKLRMRLISMLLSLNKQTFKKSAHAIRSYREAFGIDDAHAYPWWFIDTKLTEKQLNWTYRRMSEINYGWRV